MFRTPTILIAENAYRVVYIYFSFAIIQSYSVSKTFVAGLVFSVRSKFMYLDYIRPVFTHEGIFSRTLLLTDSFRLSALIN